MVRVYLLEVSFFRVVASRVAPQFTSNYAHPPCISYGLPATHKYPLPASIHNMPTVPIGNQKFGIPRKYQYQIGIWCLCPNFLVFFFLVFYRNLVYGLLKIWLIIGIFRQNKNRFGIWFPWLLFHWYWFGFGLSFS